MPDYTDADTVSGITAPSSVDVYDSVDSATLSGVTTPSHVEVYNAVNSAVLTSRTSVSADERGPFADLATIVVVSEYTGSERFTHPTGQWGPFDTENGL